ncbi:MAG: RNA polymerase sigma factor [Armatimonadota bacterium]|nr:RNA polymerase sigma factor [bacterium]
MPVMLSEYSSGFPTDSQASEETGNCGWPQTLDEFELLVDNVLDRLVWYAFHTLGNADDAEDVVQEVLVRVYADRAKRRNVQRVMPYLYRMVANACRERCRRDRNKPTAIELDRLDNISDEKNGLQTQITIIDELQWIEHLLNQLPAKQAEVIRLRVIDDLPLSDIAQILGCLLPTVKSRLCYGLRKLRQIVSAPKEGNR